MLDSLEEDKDGVPTHVHTGGTKIMIYEDSSNDDEPNFKVEGRSKGRKKSKWPAEIVHFLNDLQNEVIEHIPQSKLPILTEHQRDTVMWRGHPNFQGRGPWKDWALVDWGKHGVLPCRIWCFVDLTGLESGSRRIGFGGIHLKPNVHAVVESAEYQKDKEEIAKSDLFKPLIMDVDGMDEDGQVNSRKFYLADVEAFQGPCAVIPNVDGPANTYFLVKKRGEWANMFEDWLKKPHKEDVMEVSEADP